MELSEKHECSRGPWHGYPMASMAVKYGSQPLQVEDFYKWIWGGHAKGREGGKGGYSCKKHIRFSHSWPACWHIEPEEACVGQNVAMAGDRVRHKAWAVPCRPTAEHFRCTQGWFAPRGAKLAPLRTASSTQQLVWLESSFNLPRFLQVCKEHIII